MEETWRARCSSCFMNIWTGPEGSPASPFPGQTPGASAALWGCILGLQPWDWLYAALMPHLIARWSLTIAGTMGPLGHRPRGWSHAIAKGKQHDGTQHRERQQARKAPGGTQAPEKIILCLNNYFKSPNCPKDGNPEVVLKLAVEFLGSSQRGDSDNH